MKLRSLLMAALCSLGLSACQTPPQYWGANAPPRHAFEGLVSHPEAVRESMSSDSAPGVATKLAVVLSESTLAHLLVIHQRFEGGLSGLGMIGMRETHGQHLRSMLQQDRFVAALVQPLRKRHQVVGWADDVPQALSMGADQVVVVDLHLQLEQESTVYVYRVDYHALGRDMQSRRLLSVESRGNWLTDGEPWWTAAEKLLRIRYRLAEAVSLASAGEAAR